MYCKNCGKEITEGTMTCSSCGCSLDADASRAAAPAPASNQVCCALAIVSIVVGALGMLFAWIIALLGYIFGGAGLALGLIVMSKNREDKKGTVGVILSSITLVFALINSILGVILVLL